MVELIAKNGWWKYIEFIVLYREKGQMQVPQYI